VQNASGFCDVLLLSAFCKDHVSKNPTIRQTSHPSTYISEQIEAWMVLINFGILFTGLAGHIDAKLPIIFTTNLSRQK
jgi:hypothetical protein